MTHDEATPPPAWPIGCPKQSSCFRNKGCMYGCDVHRQKQPKDLAAEMEAEDARRATLFSPSLDEEDLRFAREALARQEADTRTFDETIADAARWVADAPSDYASPPALEPGRIAYENDQAGFDPRDRRPWETLTGTHKKAWAEVEAAAPPALEPGQPVAWRVKDFADGWILCHTESRARFEAAMMADALVQPLYLAALASHPLQATPVVSHESGSVTGKAEDVPCPHSGLYDAGLCCGHSPCEIYDLPPKLFLHTPPAPAGAEDVEALAKQLNDGCLYRQKRWSGDTHTDLGGSVDEDGTDALMREADAALMREAAAALRRMAGEQKLDLADVDRFRAMARQHMDERDKARAEAERLKARVGVLEKALREIRDHAGTHTVNRDGPKNYGYAGIYAWADAALAQEGTTP